MAFLSTSTAFPGQSNKLRSSLSSSFPRIVGLALFRPKRPGGVLGQETSHTGHVAGRLGAVYFVASANLPHEFVAGSKYDDAEQGQDKSKCRVDVPSAEDDAEVGGIPRE